MLILRPLAVWLIETSSEVLILGLILTLLLGHDPYAFLKGLLIYSSGVILLFLSTGYVFTTIVARAVWRGRRLWSYPAFATLLFFIHFEIMNVGLGGAFEPSARVRIRTAGAFITFACTLGGSFFLLKWAPANSHMAELKP